MTVQLAQSGAPQVNADVVEDILTLLQQGGASEISPFLHPRVMMMPVGGSPVHGIQDVLRLCLERSFEWECMSLRAVAVSGSTGAVIALTRHPRGEVRRATFRLAGLQVWRWHELTQP